MTKLQRRLTFFCLLTTAFLAYIIICKAIIPKFKYQTPTTQIASAFKPMNALKAFTLTDSNGNTFTAKSLKGHWTLLFFGYTGCPDICPRTLALVQQTWHQLGATSRLPARFIFADISNNAIAHSDLKMFLANYHQDFLGLTGTQEEMHKLSDQLGIYAKMLDGSQAAIIDHTAALMLIDPHARLCAIFTPPFAAHDLAHDLRILTNQY